MKLFLVLSLLFITNAWSSEYLETKTFNDVSAKIQELRTKYSPRDILIVLDIDNTLLRSKQALGSDQWFEWQSQAITNRTSEASYATFDDLLKAQAGMYQLGSMLLTEQILPQLIAGLQKGGHPMFLLTSRSPGLRNVTERELLKNQLWFAATSIARGVPNEFVEPPFKLPVSFMNGIFMTAGHHKGEAMDYLVKKSGRRLKAIVYVDDLERHTKRVYEVMSVKPDLEVVTFRYGQEDERVDTFRRSSKAEVLAQGRELSTLVRKLFN